MRNEVAALEAELTSNPNYQVIADLEKQCANLNSQLEYNWKAEYDDDPRDTYKGEVSERLQRQLGPIYTKMTNHPDYRSYKTKRNELAQLQAEIEKASR